MTIWTDLTGIAFSIEFIDAAGIRTRVLTAGEGEDVLMLHGTSGHLEAFSRNIVPHVEAGYRVHAVDALGHGYTDKPKYAYEIPKYGAHLIGYMDARGIERAHFIGESLGGWTSAWLAIHHPERVASIQLAAAGGTKADPAVMQRIKESTRKAVETEDIELTRQRMLLLMHDPKNVSDELVAVRHAIYHAPDFVANIGNLLSLQEMEVRLRNILHPHDLARIAAPTLIVWGTNNPFGGVAEATAMSQNIAGSRLEVFNECGHWPQHEHADVYNRLSVAFLDANSIAADVNRSRPIRAAG